MASSLRDKGPIKAHTRTKYYKNRSLTERSMRRHPGTPGEKTLAIEWGRKEKIKP